MAWIWSPGFENDGTLIGQGWVDDATGRRWEGSGTPPGVSPAVAQSVQGGSPSGQERSYNEALWKQLWDSTQGTSLDKLRATYSQATGSNSDPVQIGTWAANSGLISPAELQSDPVFAEQAANYDAKTGLSQYGRLGLLGIGGLMGYGALSGLGVGGAGAGGTAMPAAIPETAGALSEMGLTQTAPGVWGAGGAAAAAPLMPAAVPAVDPTFGGALAETSPGVFAAPGAAGYTGAPLAPISGVGGVSGLGAATLGAQSLGAAAGGGGGASGGGGSATGGGSGGGSWLAPEDDWWRRLIPGIPGLIGAVAAGSQAEDFEDLSHQYSQMGAPYRSRLEQLYQSPEAFLNSPEVRVPIQQGTDMLAHSLSIGGNPAGSGNALQQLQNYASGQLFSRLGQEKDRLAGFGGLTQYNQAAPQAATNVINSQRGVYDALGGAAADIFNPQRRYSLEDFMRSFR